MIGAVVLVLMCLWPVLKFVQQIVVKIVALVVIVGLAAVIWMQRANLRTCVDTCGDYCQVFGMSVEIPAAAQKAAKEAADDQGIACA